MTIYSFTQFCLLAAFGGPVMSSLIYKKRSSGGKELFWAVSAIAFSFSVYAVMSS